MLGMVVLWFLCGLVGCWLAHAISVANADDDGLAKYEPHEIFFALAGPLMLMIWAFIALGYALRWEARHDGE